MLLKERASGMYQLSAFFFARTFSGEWLTQTWAFRSGEWLGVVSACFYVYVCSKWALRPTR